MSDTRRRILDASVAMVAENGVRAVSFREVARRAGVSHQAPYHHFSNHEAILREIAREGFAALADAMERAGEGQADPVKALAMAGRAYLSFAENHVGHYRVMFQQPVSHTEVLPEAQRTKHVLGAMAIAVVESGAGEGIDPAVLAHLCWATVHGVAALAIEGALEDAGFSMGEQLVEALASLLR